MATDTKLALSAEDRITGEAIIRQFTRRCEGPLGEQHALAVVQLLDEGRREEAAQMDRAGRPGCGYDFNEIVVAGPWDGERHAYTCPKCGVSGFYGAPSYVPEPAAS